MGEITQRLRYFQGQFLRSGDFAAEQAYHLEMRRRLNLRMGLVGIVSGAEIHPDDNSVPPPPPPRREEPTASAQPQDQGVYFYSVNPGLVIDRLGREIYISAPTSLTPLLQRPGVKTGHWYELWIYYIETPSGTPAPGYQLCDQLSQQTRFTESFDFALRACGSAFDPNAPDPYEDLKGVCLGVLNVVSGPCGPAFSAPDDWYLRRRYAGIHAQKIVAPDQMGPDPFVFDGQLTHPNVVPPKSYIRLNTPHGVYAHGNMLVEKNLLIGDDFELFHDATPSNAGLPKSFRPAGNLKVAGDMFIEGQLYEKIGGNWVGLQGYIKTLVPDVQMPTTLVHFDIAAKGTLKQTVQIPTTLPSFKTADVQASIAAFQFVSQADMNAFFGLPNSTTEHPAVSVTARHSGNASATIANIEVSCFIDGQISSRVLFQSVDVALVVVFRP